MEGLTFKGNASIAVGPAWSKLVEADRVHKPIPSPIKMTPIMEKALEVADSVREVNTRKQEAVQAMAERLQSFLESSRYSLQFVPDSDQGRVIIRVLDSSGKVIRQIPPEDMARLTDGLESFTGLLVDEKLE
jgi:uncharacterized FlaG/YvyC family protein